MLASRDAGLAFGISGSLPSPRLWRAQTHAYDVDRLRRLPHAQCQLAETLDWPMPVTKVFIKLSRSRGVISTPFYEYNVFVEQNPGKIYSAEAAILNLWHKSNDDDCLFRVGGI